jgi:hypothetical protein
MEVVGIENMTVKQLAEEIDRGGRFVYFTYTISVLVMTFKRPSSVYFVPAGQSAVARGIGWTLLTFVAGWWGIPWGPIYSIGSLFTNLSGGKDVTAEIVQALNVSANS